MNPAITQSLDSQRDIMIRDHLRARGIRDQAVLKAMREVPREEFVDERFLDKAYGDYPLPIAEGQTISQPYIVAYMTQSLELSAADRLLEIGTGSGYAAAVLSRIATTVYTIEHLGRLVQEAQLRFERLGYTNVVIHEGDGTLGWPEHAPYDAIVVTAAAPNVPQPLLEQLAIGGRLVIPVGRFCEAQELIRVRRISEHDYRSEDLCGVRFVPLIGAAGWSI